MDTSCPALGSFAAPFFFLPQGPLAGVVAWFGVSLDCSACRRVGEEGGSLPGQSASCTLPFTDSCRATSLIKTTERASLISRRAWVLGHPRRSAVARLVTSKRIALAEDQGSPLVLNEAV